MISKPIPAEFLGWMLSEGYQLARPSQLDPWQRHPDVSHENLFGASLRRPSTECQSHRACSQILEARACLTRISELPAYLSGLAIQSISLPAESSRRYATNDGDTSARRLPMTQ